MPDKPGLQQSIAFFPAYPMLVRGVGRIFGGYVPGYIAAGMIVSLAAFFGALAYLYVLARDSLGEDEARFALWLTATYPFALFFSAIYAEPLLLLGLVATFYYFTNARFGRAAAVRPAGRPDQDQRLPALDPARDAGRVAAGWHEGLDGRDWLDGRHAWTGPARAGRAGRAGRDVAPGQCR